MDASHEQVYCLEQAVNMDLCLKAFFQNWIQHRVIQNWFCLLKAKESFQVSRQLSPLNACVTLGKASSNIQISLL